MMDLIFTILIILVNVSAVLNVLLILKVFFGATIRLSQRILFLVAGIFLAINSILVLIPGSDDYTGIVVFLYMLLTINILSASHRIKNSILAVPAALMYVQWGTIFMVIERLFGWDKFVYHSEKVMEVTPATIIPDVLLVVILFILFKKVEKEEVTLQLSTRECILVTIVCIVCPIIVEYLNYLEVYMENPLYGLFSLICMVSIDIALIYALVHRKKMELYKQRANQYKDQFQTEYDYFKGYRENNSQTIRFRHDWNNHMVVIKELLDKGEYERACEYFSNLTAENPVPQKSYLTGNEIVDVILNSKRHVLEENGIQLNLNGNLSELDFMKDVDCCILFSNIIDNAIEANIVEREERYITLTVKRTKSLLCIEVRNPFEDNDRHRVKDKTNGEHHGIGLQNAIDIIKKYSGEYSIEKREHIFTIRCCFTIE